MHLNSFFLWIKPMSFLILLGTKTGRHERKREEINARKYRQEPKTLLKIYNDTARLVGVVQFNHSVNYN